MSSDATDLRSWAAPEEIGLAGALAAVSDLEIALLYGLRRCGFARVDGKSLVPRDPIADIYEARVFGAAGELRWVATTADAQRGRAVFSSERGDAQPEGWTRVGGPLGRLRCDHYVLWGKARETRDGWTRLFEHRVGDLWVPIQLAVGDRARLSFTEYVGAPDEHGNLVIAAERLGGLVEYPSPDGSAA